MREAVFTVLVAWAVATAEPVFAAETVPLDDLTVMALGALDGRAVVKTADGKMHVLKVGDAIPGTNATITQMHIDKLVAEEKVTAEGAQPALKDWWLRTARKYPVELVRKSK